MRELGILGAEDGISESFSGIADRAAQNAGSPTVRTRMNRAARFAMHGETRMIWPSYHKLVRESERNAQKYHERRQADRQFGKHCKAIMKHKNREA